jgi:hypothetical protein
VSAGGLKESGDGGSASAAARQRLAGYALPYTPGPGSSTSAPSHEHGGFMWPSPGWARCGTTLVLSGG